VIGHNLKSSPDLPGRESEPAFLYFFHIFTCHDRIYELKTKYLSGYPNSKLKFEILGHLKNRYPHVHNIIFVFKLQNYI
jgi:hypothetical protein